MSSRSSHRVDDDDLPALIIDFLDSKSLVTAANALRAEFALASQGERSTSWVAALGAKTNNLYTSRLERLLGVNHNEPERPTAFREMRHPHLQGTTSASPVAYDDPSVDRTPETPSASNQRSDESSLRPSLVDLIPCSPSEAQNLRERHGDFTHKDNVIFHDPEDVTDELSIQFSRILLPVIYDPDRCCAALEIQTWHLPIQLVASLCTKIFTDVSIAMLCCVQERTRGPA